MNPPRLGTAARGASPGCPVTECTGLAHGLQVRAWGLLLKDLVERMQPVGSTPAL